MSKSDQEREELTYMSVDKGFRSIMEQSPVSIQIHTADGKLYQSNAAYAKLYALNKETLAGLYEKYNVLQDEQAEKLGVMPYIKKVFSGEASFFPEYEYNGIDTVRTLDFSKPVSRNCWVQTRGFPIKNNKGQVTHAVFFSEDVTERKIAEEERNRLFELSTDLIAIAGFDGMFKQLNPAWEFTLGYSLGELMAKPFLDFIHPDDHGKNDAEIEKLVAGHKTIDFDNRYIHKNGSVRHISWAATPAPEQGLLFCIGRDVTERKIIETKIFEYRQRLKELASELILTEEKHRREIAKDLHDHVGQLLASSRFQLAAMQKSISDEDLKQKLGKISEVLLMAVQDTRNIISDLSLPQLSELGIQAAIEDWVDEHIHIKHGVEVEFHSPRQRYSLDENVRILVFRNVRELLTNVIKHANARKVSIDMKSHENYLNITITDDGIGFDYNPERTNMSSKGGLGLFSIQERMQDIGGSLEISSAKGEGTKAVLSVPLLEARP